MIKTIVLVYLTMYTSLLHYITKISMLFIVLSLLTISKKLEKITGSRGQQKDKEEEQTKEPLNNSKATTSKSTKKSKSKQPTFSTNLKQPIEEVIEETLAEEQRTSPKTRKRPKKLKSDRQKSEQDEIGYSFFKDSFQQENVQKSDKILKEKPKAKSSLEESVPTPVDEVGFSFIPVKDKKRKPKESINQNVQETVNKENLNQKTDQKKSKKNENIPRKIATEHVDSIFNRSSVIIVNHSDSTEEFVIVEKKSKTEPKESKKVDSTLSYASVLKNEEDNKSEANVEVHNVEKSEKETVQPVEVEVDVLDKEKPKENYIEGLYKSPSFSLPLEETITKPVEEERIKEAVERTIEKYEETKKIEETETDIKQDENIEIIEVKPVTNGEVDEDRLDIQFEENKEETESNLLNLNNTNKELKYLIEDNNYQSKYFQNSEEITAVNGVPNDKTEINEESEKSILEQIKEKKSTNQQYIINEEFLNSEKSKAQQPEIKVSEEVLEVTKTNGLLEDILNSKKIVFAEEKTQILELAEEESIPTEDKTNIEAEFDFLNEEIKASVENINIDNQKEPEKERIEETKDGEQNIVEKEVPQVLENENPSTEIINNDYTDSSESIGVLSLPESDIDENEEITSGIMPSNQQLRVLTLNADEHQDTIVYRLQKGCIIQFRFGPSLLGRKVLLYCNYPKTKDFNRNTYQLLKWKQDEGCKHSDDTALSAEIHLEIAGSFHYYFIYENAETSSDHQGSGFFLVDPVLEYGNKEVLPLDCIQSQTVLSKSLGPFDKWESKLRVAKESGYNMIHFTPIQELGASNSSYSLSEQLKVNPAFGKSTTFKDIEMFVDKMRKEWKVLSICDIVLNHTANESDWIKKHPEATYNCMNCPYLRPAYLLDAALHQFTIDIQKGIYENVGIPPSDINNEEHLNSIRYQLHTKVLPKVNIPELYICDVNKYTGMFLEKARHQKPTEKGQEENGELKLIQDPKFNRLGSQIDLDLALKLYNVYRSDCFDEETRLKKCCEQFKNKLDVLNSKIVEEINGHLNAAVENVIAAIRYFRVQHDGPKIKEVSITHPLVDRYFTDYGKPESIEQHEKDAFGDHSKFLMAHNGWVMNADPLKNLASPSSNVYLRHELISWGDSVKLNYGEKPEDCPFLWNYMRQYVEQTAKIFDGVRLDNCHSTPIPVAEYLLDCARKIRPNLYVVAELFTNSDHTDNIFVNRLGITSLIREAMSAWDSHEQGRLVYRYGGVPVGAFYQPHQRPLMPAVAHALFLDLTHDNPSPVEKRSIFDLLPSTALVNMACCASGSNRGYDELVPHHIHVVNENREYTEWTEDENLAKNNPRYVSKKSGIISAKRAINNLHFELGKKGFDEVFVDQMDPDVVAVTRHNPNTHESYILVAFTAFGHPPEDAAYHQRGIRPLRVEGVLDEVVMEATLSHISEKKYKRFENYFQDSKYINGVTDYEIQMKEHIQIQDSDFLEMVNSGTPNTIQLNFRNFKPGSIVLIKVSLPEDVRNSVKNVHNLMRQFYSTEDSDLVKIVKKLGLPDLNRALYRCDHEERDEGFGFDTYNVPNWGRFVYAGLQGIMSPLSNIRTNNDLGHPICQNLRDGNWMIDYIWQRLKLDDGTNELGKWFEENTKSLKAVPRYLIPRYFDLIVTGVYTILLEQSFNSMDDFVKNGSTFVRGLSLGSLQLAAYIKSADLPVLSPNLAPPKPPQRKNDKEEMIQSCVSLSAGLPHFSVGYMRNWGRDTFIALRGLLLLTGRHQDARYHILAYAACLRHGLIPNLLDGGRNPRYNCRDAIWWWSYSIKCYVEEVPNGISILSDIVSRIYPSDDSPAQSPGVHEQTLEDIIQEALNVHFQGLIFRERNAGRQIDEHMTDKGFNNQIGIHPDTGFVFGGNDANCGTWMDKMGSSAKAGNKGKPATPRDGSAVELIGLSKAVISWLAKLHQQGLYKYDGVERVHKNGTKTKWTFVEWSNKIQQNFEKYFWVNLVKTEGEIRPDLINKRGIYKDSHGASQPWSDYQLRCNFPIAMVVAPELFTPQHAWIALQMAEKYLLGPLGMKTLDPEDWAYNGNYNNSDDSDNFNTANGFNYHQGPEWVWPIGFYLRAKLIFAEKNNKLNETVDSTKVILSKHFVELQTSPWRGLPELTNENGSFCHDSCRTQAWSMSCILEVLNDLQIIETKKDLTQN